MCSTFLKYLEKKFACLGQSENDKDSSDKHSYKNSYCSRHSSADDDNSYEEDSLKSYRETESSGEDVVESTGRRRTRSSTYADCSSKATQSTDENTEALDSIDQQNRKSCAIEDAKKEAKSKVGSNTRNELEIQEKSSKSKPREKPTHKELLRNSSVKERLNQDRSSTKPQTVEDKTVKQKDDKRSPTVKEHEKATTDKADLLRKSPLKAKWTEKNVYPNHKENIKEKPEKEKNMKKSEEKQTNEEKKEKVKIPVTPRRSNKKSTSSSQEKYTAQGLSKLSSKKLELGNQKGSPFKTFATKSIQKRRP